MNVKNRYFFVRHFHWSKHRTRVLISGTDWLTRYPVRPENKSAFRVCLLDMNRFFKKCKIIMYTYTFKFVSLIFVFTDDRPYQCEICKASFKRNHQMKLHKQTVHSDLRLYHCELCEKSFKRRDKLTCHYRTHSDEHPFMCTECGSVFKWKHHLKRHRDNVHADKASQIKARRFPCSVCGNCFKWRHHLKRHLRNVHRLFDGLWDGEDTKMSLDSENSLAVPKSSLPVVGSEELSKVDGNS